MESTEMSDKCCTAMDASNDRGYDIRVDIEDNVGKERKHINGDLINRRSESDSDLDSAKNSSDLFDNEKDSLQSNRTHSPETHHHTFTESTTDQYSINGNNGHVEATYLTSGKDRNLKSTEESIEQQPIPGVGKEDNKSNVQSGPVEYAQLTQKEIDDKLRDDDVIRQGELLETVREVGVTNLNKLQHLNWNDPALRRLFMKPKINKVEVSSVKVDPDIKNLVNEFLRANVTEDFVISRVLRENYATFFSWLTSHLQTERNAWTTRLAQAFDQADQERKSSLHCRNLVVEAAARLRMLVKTSSNILYGIPNKDDEIFFEVDAHRRHANKRSAILQAGIKNGKKHDVSSNDVGYMSEGNTSRLRRCGNKKYNKSPRDKNNDLVPSNFRLIKVTDTGKQGQMNYESDPGEMKTTDPLCNNKIQKIVPFSESENKLANNRMHGPSKAPIEKKNNNPGKFSPTSTLSDNADTGDSYSGYDLEGLLIEDDKCTDWNQVLMDNIDVLTDVCDTLLIDRKSCLQIMKADPNRCASLVDAVSAFVKSRHGDMGNKRDIEKRLRLLEKENKTLQEEMSVLQKTLADKNRDAHNLQSQLDRLEDIIQSYTTPKLNKCVGTIEDMFPAVFRNNLTVGGNKTPRQNNSNVPAMPKLSKSPRSVEKESKSKTVELPSVNGINNIKQLKQNRELNLTNNSCAAKDQEKITSLDLTEQTSHNDSSALQQTMQVREPSLIEISEEKLKTLKHRAKKLEDSLHDAITSMVTLDKPSPRGTSSMTTISPYGKINVKNGPMSFKRWQKTPLEESSNSLENRIPQSTATPRVAVIKRSNYYSKQSNSNTFNNTSTDQSSTAPDIHISSASDTSSLLEGRSIPTRNRDETDRTYVSSRQRIGSERTNGIPTTHSSRSNFDDCPSDDEHSQHSHHTIDGVSTYRRQINQAKTNDAPSVQYQGSQGRRLRARHNTSRLLAGKQTVSKCLRCHKLFSPTDNHKLACCYHTKDKERLEHYDQSGMLIRVIHAWKCCNEPQESEGCCYGQHQ